ncbi:MAG: hypothetical protein [Circoviridae sp.]|nr:MAG: hypothetical protein [Circoviridae sp.]
MSSATNAARSGLNEHHFNLDYSDNATCIHNLYVYTALRRFMAKLYWRIKKNGKWTWVAAIYDLHVDQCTHPDGEMVTLWWPTEHDVEGILHRE